MYQKSYSYYKIFTSNKKTILFHVTLTPYKKDIEPNVEDKTKIIKAIQELSQLLGKENVYVRYDPVFINDKYSLEYHIKAFDKVCKLLDGHIEHIIISFLDDYKNVRKNISILKSKKLTEDDYQKIGINFSNSAKQHGMTVQTCCEATNLTEYGFIKEDCLSHELAYRLTGKANFKNWKVRKDKNCKCVEMVDIGYYNSCSHFCRYCYANYDEQKVFKNRQNHDINSSLLIGHLENDDIVKKRI